jgi:hypothetical protein
VKSGNIKTVYYILKQGFPMQKEPWEIKVYRIWATCRIQTTRYRIQHTCQGARFRIQKQGTACIALKMQGTSHKVQDTGCSVQYAEYTRQVAIQGIRTKG